MSQEQPTLEEQLKTLQEENQMQKRLIEEASKENFMSPVLVSPVIADENEVVRSKEFEDGKDNEATVTEGSEHISEHTAIARQAFIPPSLNKAAGSFLPSQVDGMTVTRMFNIMQQSCNMISNNLENASARGTASALPGTSFVPPLLLLD